LKLIKLSLRLKYLRKNALSEFKNIMNDILSKCSIFWKYLSLLFSSLNKVFKFFTKLLFKHDVITISELWIAPIIFIFQDKMTPPKHLTPAGKGKAKVDEYAECPAESLQKVPQQIEFLLGLENPTRLTPAEKGKAKVNKYDEPPAENQQKFPQQIEFFNLETTKSIVLEEVLQTSTKYSRGDLTNYPFHIQILLDNLTQAFLKHHKNLHDKYHLSYNKILSQSIASSNNQPAAKIFNWIRSPTGIYQIQRISPKEMGKIRQRVLDLPGEIQNLIFTSSSYTEYFDRWIQRMMLITNGKDLEYKKVYGAKTLRVFEPHCEFPGII